MRDEFAKALGVIPHDRNVWRMLTRQDEGEVAVLKAQESPGRVAVGDAAGETFEVPRNSRVEVADRDRYVVEDVELLPRCARGVVRGRVRFHNRIIT